MIEIQDLHFAYRRDGFCLQVDRMTIPGGQRLAWVGRSGSGKTTLLHLLAGILCPSSGSIVCCSSELTDLDDGARRDFRAGNVGLVFQDFALLDYLTVLDNILLPYHINRSLRLDETVRHRARQLAEEVGIGDYLSRRPTDLSHGERQRIAVCRALIASPAVILADEPTANLDEDNAGRVVEALDQHARRHGSTLIVVTHDAHVRDRFEQTVDVSDFCHRSAVEIEGGHAL